jgi:branched-chain amino acid aminotransferase
MINAIVNLNGQLFSGDTAKISVFDRSYLYGDSLYEVARSYQGEFFLLDQHLNRLSASAQLAHITLDQSLNHYRNEIYKTFEAFRKIPENSKQEAYARIIISRGVGKIGFGVSCLLTPTQYTIIIQPVEPPTAEQFQKGMSLRVVDRIRNDRRALDPAMKSGNYLNSLLAYLEANDTGHHDALLCNSEGHVTEGTTFNIFYVRRGIIATPPLDIGILEGITRERVLQLATQLDLPWREVRFPKERLYEADEVFLTSSVREVFPVSQVDQHKIGNGKPGVFTLELSKAYKNSILGEKK